MELHVKIRVLVSAAAVLAIAAPLQSQQPQRLPGARGDFLVQMGQIEQKFEALTSAFPDAKYGWTPGKGVRTVCEVFAHITAENYGLGAAFGAAPAPKGLEDGEHVKCIGDQKATLAAMKASFAAIKTAVTNMKDSDLDQPATLFGFPQPKRAWLSATTEHAGEHLGQMIAYARMNNIVPPWSK